MKCKKYYILGFIPLLYREQYKDYVTWKLLKFFPIITIKTSITKENKSADISIQNDMYYDIA